MWDCTTIYSGGSRMWGTGGGGAAIHPSQACGGCVTQSEYHKRNEMKLSGWTPPPPPDPPLIYHDISVGLSHPPRLDITIFIIRVNHPPQSISSLASSHSRFWSQRPRRGRHWPVPQVNIPRGQRTPGGRQPSNRHTTHYYSVWTLLKYWPYYVGPSAHQIVYGRYGASSRPSDYYLLAFFKIILHDL